MMTAGLAENKNDRGGESRVMDLASIPGVGRVGPGEAMGPSRWVASMVVRASSLPGGSSWIFGGSRRILMHAHLSRRPVFAPAIFLSRLTQTTARQVGPIGRISLARAGKGRLAANRDGTDAGADSARPG